MAILCRYITVTGILIDRAYVNIPNINIVKQTVGGVSKFIGTIHAAVYASYDAYISQKPIVESFSISSEMPQSVSMTMAYYLLKTAVN